MTAGVLIYIRYYEYLRIVKDNPDEANPLPGELVH